MSKNTKKEAVKIESVDAGPGASDLVDFNDNDFVSNLDESLIKASSRLLTKSLSLKSTASDAPGPAFTLSIFTASFLPFFDIIFFILYF